MTDNPRDGDFEEFRPISVKYDTSVFGRALFYLRICADLQLLTIFLFMRRHAPQLQGTVVDVGCGESPFALLLRGQVDYIGLDIETAPEFGMSPRRITYFDGETIPLGDSSADHVICTEVLEHVGDPQALIDEIYRILKPGGTFLGTVPFSARVHHRPFDFCRFTEYGLRKIFSRFSAVEVCARGTDISAIASKLVVVALRLGKFRRASDILWRPACIIVAGSLAVASLVVAHCAILLGLGSSADPLGYAIRAIKDNINSCTPTRRKLATPA